MLMYLKLHAKTKIVLEIFALQMRAKKLPADNSRSLFFSLKNISAQKKEIKCKFKWKHPFTISLSHK